MPRETSPIRVGAAPLRRCDRIATMPPSTGLSSVPARFELRDNLNGAVGALDDFPGTSRFRVIRRIGAGGMGIVYEAMDAQRGSVVALKTLQRLSGPALYRFKREFRSLAEVTHPNIVQLHELFSGEGAWFFTMELVRGRELLHYVRAGVANGASDRVTSDALASTEPGDDAPPHHVRSSRPPAPCGRPPPSGEELARLRRAIAQLAQGLAALHDAGKIHRDVKPSNVLVAEGERVVLLDFGIVLDARLQDQSEVEAVTGTPAYMAPEQVGGALTPAADWYSLGVVLFEALTGRLPFVGPPLRVLMEKQMHEAPRIELADVPDDLAELSAALLRRRPEERPRADEILRRLGVAADPSPRPTYRTMSRTFVGRADSLAALRDAAREARAGCSEMVLLRGPSGIGKSTLAQRFLEEASMATDAVVLVGRCYERESVPYKAFDTIVDALTHHLRRLPAEELAASLPRDIHALARVFPVLDRVPAIAQVPRRRVEPSDPQRLRASAFGALREMFERLALRRSVIVFIDDLQWGDADSLVLLGELTSPPDPPAMLTILSFRAEDETRSDALAALQRVLHATPRERPPRTLTLEGLSPDESRLLATELLVDADDARRAVLDQIASESQGSPLFVGELVRHAQLQPARGSEPLQLDHVLGERVAELTDGPLTLLQVLSVFARPIRLELATAAAEQLIVPGADAPDWLQAVSILRAGHFVRTSPASGGGARIETYHDRVRETVARTLSQERLVRIHTALADALRGAPDIDPETLFAHHRAAGMRERAVDYAETAARNALHALAFDRAAELFRLGLDLLSPEDSRVQTFRVEHARALMNAGRGSDAAQAFLAAATHAKHADRLELRRHAAEQFLSSGHLREGMATLDDVLRYSGMRLAPSTISAVVSLLLLRLWAIVRGLHVALRDRSEISDAEIHRIDICWSTLLGLGIVDNIRAAEFSARHLMLALRAGEPFRATRAIATEGFFVGSQGTPRSNVRAARMIEAARRLAERSADPYLRALLENATAWRTYFSGEFDAASAAFDRSRSLFEEHGIGARWERDNVLFFGLCSAFYRGDLRAIAQRLPIEIREAHDRGDLHMETLLRIGDTNVHWLVADDPDGARGAIDEIMSRWPRDRFLVQHMYEARSKVLIDLYEGGGGGSIEAYERTWRPMRRAMLLRLEMTRARALYTRACLRLAAAEEDPRHRSEHVARARADAGRIDRTCPMWARALGHLLMAGAARVSGDDERSRGFLERAIAGFDERGMQLFATIARLRLGETIAGDEGRARVSEANAWLRDRGVKRPERIARVFAPGFIDGSRGA